MSRIRSPITSRSNWANESNTFNVSRPIEVVVLNAWVTETNETLCRSKISTMRAKSVREREQPVDLVDDDDVDRAVLDVAQQPLQGGALHGAAGEAAVVVAVADADPALVLLARDVGQRRLALGVERVELHVEPLVGRDAGVDGRADFADGRLHLPLR